MKVGVWEGEDGFARALEGLLPGGTIVSRHPAAFSERTLELLLVSPGAAGWAGAGTVACRTVLLPGAAMSLARILRTERAVSYGSAPRDTLTFSSLEEGHISIALQREVETITGRTVERQEFRLPLPQGVSPYHVLALAGARILLTGSPRNGDNT